MKTETQIAKKNIKERSDKDNNRERGIVFTSQCMEHKATCQRFLEFLIETFTENINLTEGYLSVNPNLKKPYNWIKSMNKKFEDKIADLKQAIKLYEDAGI